MHTLSECGHVEQDWPLETSVNEFNSNMYTGKLLFQNPTWWLNLSKKEVHKIVPVVRAQECDIRHERRKTIKIYKHIITIIVPCGCDSWNSA